jgi:hypothetical protein
MLLDPGITISAFDVLKLSSAASERGRISMSAGSGMLAQKKNIYIVALSIVCPRLSSFFNPVANKHKFCYLSEKVMLVKTM